MTSGIRANVELTQFVINYQDSEYVRNKSSFNEMAYLKNITRLLHTKLAITTLQSGFRPSGGPTV